MERIWNVRHPQPPLAWWSHELIRPHARGWWRAIVPAQALDGQLRRAGCDAAEPGGVAVYLDSLHEGGLAWIEATQAAGCRVLLDHDDDPFSDELPVVAVTLRVQEGDPLHRWLGIEPGERRLMVRADASYRDEWRRVHREAHGLADGVTVTTETIAASVRPHARAVHVVPNRLPPGGLPVEPKPDDGVFRVGYASGGIGARDDAEKIRDALAAASRLPGVEVVLIGCDPLRDFTIAETGELWAGYRDGDLARLRDLAEQVHARRSRWATFPFTVWRATPDMDEYRRLLAQLDVGLAPLDRRLTYSRGRSESKLLDYCSAAVAPVLDLTAEPYQDAADAPCVPASSPPDFTLAVEELCADRRRARALGQEAQAWATEHRANVSEAWAALTAL